MKEINIESYDGEDAFYSGSEEDYEDFLKSVDGKIPFDGAEPVENTQRINLSETINLHGVLERFRKKAGQIAQASKKFTNDVAEQISAKAYREKQEEEHAPAQAAAETRTPESNNAPEPISAPKTAPEPISAPKTAPEPISAHAPKPAPPVNTAEDEIVSIDLDEIRTEITAAVKTSLNPLDTIKDELTALKERICENDGSADTLRQELADANKRLQSIITDNDDFKRENTRAMMEIQSAVSDSLNRLTDISQTVNGVTKLTDSVFDLKNTQLNTKKSIDDLEMSFKRLKKKCILGITVLSILAAITIALQIVLLLS